MKIFPVRTALSVLSVATLSVTSYSAPSLAAAPDIKTPAPVIYLADNLDEKDQLGWCIDTLGRGFAERLQAHSCKPRGGDVQFALDTQSNQIKSVEFADYCMALKPDDQTVFSLETCDQNAAEQRFSYDTSTRELKPLDQSGKCIVVGPGSRSAGPFMSRELLLENCSTTDAVFKEWVVQD